MASWPTLAESITCSFVASPHRRLTNTSGRSAPTMSNLRPEQAQAVLLEQLGEHRLNFGGTDVPEIPDELPKDYVHALRVGTVSIPCPDRASIFTKHKLLAIDVQDDIRSLFRRCDDERRRRPRALP